MVIQIQHLSVEEFDDWVLLPENAGQMFEYIGGEIVEVVSNNYSSMIGMFIGAMLTIFVRTHALGYVTGADGGYRVSGERYIPDAAFISKARQPQPFREAYNPNPPDLAVEVLSPTNDPGDMRVKIANYLLAGAVLWVVDPEAKRVEVYVSGQAAKTLTINDVLDGGSVLPGFSLPGRDIFPEEPQTTEDNSSDNTSSP